MAKDEIPTNEELVEKYGGKTKKQREQMEKFLNDIDRKVTLEDIYEEARDLIKYGDKNSIAVCSNAWQEEIEEFKINLTVELHKDGITVVEPEIEYGSTEKFVIALYGLCGKSALVIIDHCERYFLKESEEDYELILSILNEERIDRFIELNGKPYHLDFSFKDCGLKFLFIFGDEKCDILERSDKTALKKVGAIFEMPRVDWGKDRVCNYCGKSIPHGKEERIIGFCKTSPNGKHRFRYL